MQHYLQLISLNLFVETNAIIIQLLYLQHGLCSAALILSNHSDY